MSNQLFIVRHGKSDWSVDVEDFYRPLKKRGYRAAFNLGKWMKKNNVLPEYILTSPATRALATTNEIIDITGINNCLKDARIYEASLDQLIDVLSEVPEYYQKVMIVGHNPGFESLLLNLAKVDSSFYQEEKLLTTGTLAIVNLTVGWNEIGKDCGQLQAMVRGKDL